MISYAFMVLTWLGCTRWMQVQVQVRCDGVFTPTPQRGMHIDVNVTVRVSNSIALNKLSAVWHLEHQGPRATHHHSPTTRRHGDTPLSVLNQDALLTQDEGWRRGGNVR